jgi:hypothetical protein
LAERISIDVEAAMRAGVRLFLAAAVLLGLAGCGSNEPDRLSGGTAGGAATGAAIGLIGGPIGVVLGAGIGAGVGAMTSTNTTPQQVNLGKPLWDHRVTVQ